MWRARYARYIPSCHNRVMRKPAPLIFGGQLCGDLDEGSEREWLVADGRGGYAAGTVSGLRTRSYHALQVVASPTAASRRVGLLSLDPVVVLPSGEEVRLAVHEWASGAVEPRGNELLESFTLADGLPRWRWRIGGVLLECELAAVSGRPALGVVHRLRSGGPVRLRLEALCTWRDAHGERFADGGDLAMTPCADGVIVENAYRLAGPGWTPAGVWWRDVRLREAAARGLGDREDVWFAGSFTAELADGEAIEVSSWAGDLGDRPAPAAAVVDAARRRARDLCDRAADEVEARLFLAADAFVVQGPNGAPDVVAGYPWFGSWSRDTMLPYEGLFLSTGRADEGRALLRSYAATVSEGMLANTADTGSVEYNTADATLWFVHALGRHVAVTGDTDLAAELAAPLESVLRAHIEGTRYGLGVDPVDSLLNQGADGLALTWMDARIGGVPVTARRGKAVDINALWCNALGVAADLARRAGRDDGDLRKRYDATTDSFRARFPAPAGWLYDVIDGPTGADAALRPNQLLAYSLPFGPMRGEQPAPAIARDLLTPLGLRTLAPEEPGYRPRHRGTPAQRDSAYHQGTVWPWLIGPCHDAYSSAASRADAKSGNVGGDLRDLLGGIVAHLGEAGLGSVSETADGAPPHRPTGCPFQAWSVGETTRVWQAREQRHSQRT
jgi:predicted glycogen debranching enzyme